MGKEIGLSNWSFIILQRANGVCQKCGRLRKEGERRFHSHHIIPLKKGGRNVIKNGISLCPKCHRDEHSLKCENPDCKCFKCNYTWKRKVLKPKACPKCKTRLGYKKGEGKHENKR